jgi:hypothetical protein
MLSETRVSVFRAWMLREKGLLFLTSLRLEEKYNRKQYKSLNERGIK